MGRINRANLKKTIYYLKRNGIQNTWYAVRERLEERKAAPYSFVPVSEEELEKQRRWSTDKSVSFSVVVPTYRTNEVYLREMIQSVMEQTYPHWELVLADATEDDSVKRMVGKITADIIQEEQRKGCESASSEDSKCQEGKWKKIKYIKLPKNAGIAANTNQALLHATGDYIGLLDHDDLLTPDALYEMAVCIENGKEQGMELQMLYSDEDKCNGLGTHYYEPNIKEKFNLDLLLSNNYICHFLVMKSELIKKVGFRSEYDGAQDYDLVLRAASQLHALQIAHIPKVLYHWRCHTGSTAENPQSKQYAYDAGLRALQDFSDAMGYGAKAVPLKHLGFYTLQYSQGALKARPELGAVGGRVLGKDSLFSGWKIIGGRMSERYHAKNVNGTAKNAAVYYEGLPAEHSGYLHRAVLTQTAEAVDIRCIQVREECRELFEQVVGVPYQEIEGMELKHDLMFNAKTLPAHTDYKALSLQFGKALHEAGYDILYDPSLTTSWKGEA